MLYFFVDEFRNILATIFLELVLLMPSVKRREKFWLRLPVGILGSLAFTLLYYFVRYYIYHTDSFLGVASVSALWYIAVLAVTGLLMYGCFELYSFEVVWTVLTAYAAQHMAYAIVCECFVGSMLVPGQFWRTLGIYALAAAAIDVGIYFAFLPYTRQSEHLLLVRSRKATLALGAVLVVFLISTFVNQHSVQATAAVGVLAGISDVVNCMFVLIVQYLTLYIQRITLEKEAAEKRLENEQKQYAAFKNAVDYINIKCHDLKREIRRLTRSGTFDESSFEEMVDQIAFYESFAQTGNETLDSLLTDVNVSCIQNGISFSCIADASRLNQMEDRDVYALFGNMLDNAVECVERLSLPEKKFIRLMIRPQGEIVVIHQENGFDGPLKMENGLPLTTKGNNIYHGFGMRSMRRVLRKYGGELRVDAVDGLFRIDAILSLKQEKP